MKNFFRNRILGALALIGLVALSGVAFALTSPPSFPARVVPWQANTHFRKTVNFNDANIGVGIKFGALPAGAYITGIRCYVTTAFNAGTTNNLKLGTTQAGADLLAGGVTAGTNCVAATLGNQSMTLAPGLGLAVTGGATPTGSTGAWDLWVQYAQTGTAATTGQVTLLIDYVANDDQ